MQPVSGLEVGQLPLNIGGLVQRAGARIRLLRSGRQPTGAPPVPLSLRWDIAVYTAGALHAALVWAHSDLVLHRRWGQTAVVGYAVAALGALGLWVLARWFGAKVSTHLRLALAVIAVLGALVVPLAVNVERRVDTGSTASALSEVLVVENGADVALRGGDPYATTFSDRGFSNRHPSIREHFPYLPGMLIFGLPRAVFGDHLFTDARVAFAFFSLLVVGIGFVVRPAPGRLWPGGAMLLFVLSPGAMALATGGDDIPVLALLFLATVLAGSMRPGRAGLAAGGAMALKQLAWPVAVLIMISVAARDRRGAQRMVLAAGGVVAAASLPLLSWSPTAFFADTVQFPLGLTKVATVAASPTLGRLLSTTLDGHAPALAAAASIGMVAFAFAVRAALSSLPRAVFGAAVLVGVAVVLAPATRFGLLVYPVHLALCARLISLPTHR